MIDDEIHVNIYGRCEISLVREIGIRSVDRGAPCSSHGTPTRSRVRNDAAERTRRRRGQDGEGMRPAGGGVGPNVPSCQSRSPPPPLLSPSSTVSCSDPIAVRGQSTDSGMDWRVVEVTLMLGEAKFITSWGAETCVWSPSHRLLLLGPKPRRPGVATSPSCEGGEEQLRRRRHGRGERRCAVSPAAAAPPF